MVLVAKFNKLGGLLAKTNPGDVDRELVMAEMTKVKAELDAMLEENRRQLEREKVE
jgi:hypothetical protein